MFIDKELVNKLHKGDTRELIKKIPDKTVDLIITSPAYFQQRTYQDSPLEMGREASLKEYLDELLVVFDECVRITKDTGSIVFNLGDKYIDESLLLVPYRFAIAASERDVNLINNTTWIKSNPTPRQYKRRMVQATEPFFHFTRKNCKNYKYYYDRLLMKKEKKAKPDSKIGQGYYKLINDSAMTSEQKKLAGVELGRAIQKVKNGEIDSIRMKITGIHAPAFGGQAGGRSTQMKQKGYTIIEVPGDGLVKDWFQCPVESLKNVGHLAIYPQSIVERFIVLTTDENDLIFDPFMGSGTTACAAKVLNRHYLGFELFSDYIEIATGRIAKAL